MRAENVNDPTKIPVTERVKQRIKSHASKTETFSDVLNRIIDFYEQNKDNPV